MKHNPDTKLVQADHVRSETNRRPPLSLNLWETGRGGERGRERGGEREGEREGERGRERERKRGREKKGKRFNHNRWVMTKIPREKDNTCYESVSVDNNF